MEHPHLDVGRLDRANMLFAFFHDHFRRLAQPATKQGAVNGIIPAGNPTGRNAAVWFKIMDMFLSAVPSQSRRPQT